MGDKGAEGWEENLEHHPMEVRVETIPRTREESTVSKETEPYLALKGNGDYKYGQYFQEMCCVKEWQLMKEDVGLQ